MPLGKLPCRSHQLFHIPLQACSLLDTCRRAQELRSTLNYTAEAKATLQAALDTLQQHGQPQNAAALEDAIRAGEAAGDVLEDDVAHAKQAAARWHAGVATEAKLNRALKDGTSAHMLGRAVQVNAPPTCQQS